MGLSCKKAIEDKKEDLVLDAMTNGRWYVYSFVDAGQDITASFSPYEFQFYRDGKVSGLSSTGEVKGTWDGDPNAMTISASFPEAGDPVKKLNALWKVVDNSWDYVKAQTTVDGSARQLYLKKK
ncbi:hypothetical protein [Flavihumibacter petaseus]|uniref:hypothetical protein n=1 Tax=Flavihumibacter petaseus TaxID=549295 RepID=UPI0012FC940D|nr:hypothetical protein [Flavihumibacter petaseus]